MPRVTPPTKVGSRANASNKTAGKPANLGPRGKSAKGYSATKPKSVAKTPSSPNTRAVVSRTPDPKGKMSAAQLKASKARTKTAMKKTIKAAKPSGVTKAATNTARAVRGAANGVRGSVAGAAVGIANKGKKAAQNDRRRNYENATGKKLST
jgi:hypothetical protein